MRKIFFILSAFCLPVGLYSTTLTVTNNAFSVETEGSLPYCIANAESGDVIAFHADLSGATIAFTEALELTSSLHFDASSLEQAVTFVGIENATTGMRPKLFVLKGNANEYSFKNLIFTQGKPDGDDTGGAITSEAGKLEIEGCRFIDNGLLKDSESLSPSGHRSGAIHVAYRDADVHIRGCVFKGNNGRKGGAISLQATNTLIEGCLFQGNSAWNQSSALYVSNGAGTREGLCITLLNSTIAEGHVPTSGGANGSAIYTDASGDVAAGEPGSRPLLRLISCTFYGNTTEKSYSSVVHSNGRAMEVGACIFAQNNFHASGNGNDLRIVSGKEGITSLGYNVYNDFRLNGQSSDPVHATDMKYTNSAWASTPLLPSVISQDGVLAPSANDASVTTYIKRIPLDDLKIMHGVETPIDQLGVVRAATASVGACEASTSSFLTDYAANKYGVSVRDNMLYVDNLHAGKIQIFSMTGALVLQKTIDQSAVRLDVSSLSAGMYLLHAVSGDQVVALKFVK